MGSGCCSVGRVVTSDSRGPQFESGHQQKCILYVYCQLYWKDENKEKEAEISPFYKNIFKLDCLLHSSRDWPLPSFIITITRLSHSAQRMDKYKSKNGKALEAVTKNIQIKFDVMVELKFCGRLFDAKWQIWTHGGMFFNWRVNCCQSIRAGSEFIVDRFKPP